MRGAADAWAEAWADEMDAPDPYDPPREHEAPWREDFPDRDDAHFAGHVDVVMDDGATTLTFTPAPATDGAA